MQATQPGSWTNFPWHGMGNWKYILYAPLVARAVHSNFMGGREPNNFCLHMLIVAAIRYCVGQLGVSLSRNQYLIGKHEIQRKGITFETVDLSNNWDDYILLQALILVIALQLPIFAGEYPVRDLKGLLICFLLHFGPIECIYYWLHRALHNHWLFSRYHSHHHSLFITEANSGTVHPFAEHLMYAILFALPILGTWALGGACLWMVYAYPIYVDTMNAIGHCNVEFVPEWLFRAIPPLRYLVYTPSYHSLHHSQVHTNFCLYMPIYDYLGGTLDKHTNSLYHSVRQGNKEKPDFVYMTHGTDLLHMFHVTLGFQSFSAMPYSTQWYLWPLYPLAMLVMALFWAFGTPFAADKYRLPNLRGQTWVMPRYCFQYSVSFEMNRINKMIEKAIYTAENEGAQVISLGALNKKEILNGGGQLFVERNKNLRIRVVNGDTLTAAVVLDRVPKDAQEVFLVGSSEVARAVAIHLCRQSVRVLMWTKSRERFEHIQAELPTEKLGYLVPVTKFQAGQHCTVWILGETAELKDQAWAPPGTHFHQFGLANPLARARSDCTYGQPPAMRVPSSIKGLRSCEVSMPREVVHTCHAAGLVHTLEKWEHHEVGAIEIDQIDTVWKAALKHGFRPHRVD